jgi:hypothetical protein
MEKEMEKAKNLVKYCDSVYKTQRRKTRTVHCGDVPIGTTSITTYIDTCTYLTKTFTPCNLPIGTTYGLHTLPHIFFLFFGTTYGLHTLPHTYFTTYLLYLCTSSPSMKTPQFLLLLLGITPSAKHHSMK